MTSPKHASTAQQAWLWGSAALVLLLDQITKFRVEALYALGESSFPIPALSPVLRLVHVYNQGAAFGILQGFGWFFSLVAFGVAGYILYVNYLTTGPFRPFRITLGLIMGGALGNVIDRFRLGHVTDFIHVNFRPLAADLLGLDLRFLDIPVFNWADTAIIGGVIIMGFLMWTGRLPEETQVTPLEPKVAVPLETTLDVYEPRVRQPDDVETHPERWRVARFGVQALSLLALGLLFWVLILSVSFRRGRRR